MQSICIYSGANHGISPAYVQAATELGRHLGTQRIRVVFGGARLGLMGALADAALAAGGEVIGVLPRPMEMIAHRGLSALHLVDSMHTRKALMADLSDGFIALPGGIGTLEELLEVLTWTKLGFHAKPCGVLNVAGYFDLLLSFLGHVVDQGFMGEAHRHSLIADANVERLLQKLAAFRARPDVVPA